MHGSFTGATEILQNVSSVHLCKQHRASITLEAKHSNKLMGQTVSKSIWLQLHALLASLQRKQTKMDMKSRF